MIVGLNWAVWILNDSAVVSCNGTNKVLLSVLLWLGFPFQIIILVDNIEIGYCDCGTVLP